MGWSFVTRMKTSKNFVKEEQSQEKRQKKRKQHVADHVFGGRCRQNCITVTCLKILRPGLHRQSQ